MTETTTTRPNIAEATQRAGDARHRPLPPGQRAIDWFPRFGTDLGKPAPISPTDPVVEIGGAVTGTFAVPVAELATLPRRRLDADFHCVSGWTAVGIHWEGVAFAEFYRLRIEPTLRPGTVVTHVEFRGLDGFRSVITIEDALNDDVLLADHLDGEPLDNDHGAPLRLVSPAQYGYMSTKHLCRIDLHTAAPTGGPDRSCSTCCSTPIPERGSGRKSATGRCPAGWSDPSTKPSQWSCCAAADSDRATPPKHASTRHSPAANQPHQHTVWVATWHGSGRAAPGGARLPPVRLVIVLAQIRERVRGRTHWPPLDPQNFQSSAADRL